jgi:hypothetical protein
LFDQIAEAGFSKLAEVETAGTEKNIPQEGRLIIGFLPHAGFLEPVLIDRQLQARGRKPAVWITKKQTTELPLILQSERRLIYVDRENPGPSSIRAVKEVLKTPKGTIASALEGTRYSNPDDENEVLFLGKTLPGLMRFSFEADAQIIGVVILGVDQILPSLDKTLKEKGITEALRLLYQCGRNPRPVQIRFLPPYTDHLQPEYQDLKGRKRVQFVDGHNQRLTSLLIREILALNPQFPLGYYQGK